MLEVAEHYDLFDGVSPINAQNRALLTAILTELNEQGPQLPIYWGNRNWHPLLADTVGQMAEDGIRRALAFVTSAFASYSGCRQYLEDIERARTEVGSNAPSIDKLRLFYNHPGFVEPMAERVLAALAEIPADRRDAARLIYTAHSLPQAMASKCEYEAQLREACRLVSERAGRANWELVYQSRSGPPSQPWLEPDICDYIKHLAEFEHGKDVVVAPIGFLSEHMEVIYDLDVEAAELCDELGLNMIRAGVVGTHPRFVKMIRELVIERLEDDPKRAFLGDHGPSHDMCPPDCCPPR
jgi:ferrochelatase